MIGVQDHGNRRGLSMPRSIVRFDGIDMWFSSWSVTLNPGHQADEFSIELPFRITQDQTKPWYLMNTPVFETSLLTQSDVLVEIFVGYPQDPDQYGSDELTRLMYGYVDSVEIGGSASGESVSVRGRSMASLFLDNKTSENFRNSTASQIADTLAKRRGLKAQISPTFTHVGAYYNDDAVETQHEQSEWDLLTFLAEKEGMELRVRDDTLYFGSFDQVVGAYAGTAPLAYTWGQNVESFSISREPHGAKNLEIEVHSYQSGSSNQVTGKAKREFPRASSTHKETYYYPGLTQEQAQKKADALLQKLSRLELTGSVRVPGHEGLLVDKQIALYGVGMGMSQYYYIRRATHSFDSRSGYRTSGQFSNILMTDQE